ncbi:MAG: type 4a pilus biogenesis protein PilO [Acidobacteriota bacterium]|nr:type 4a pilus biogenesis protein PilO [Acidobacteriota bacterium]
MSLKNLPWWGYIVGASVVALVIWWFGSNFAPADLTRKGKQVANLEQQLEKKQAEIRKAKQAVAKIDELEREIADLELKLADLKQILPTSAEMGDLLKWIKSLADQTNLDLRVFNPQGPKDQEFLREQPISMEVFGNYHQLGMFFDRVSKYARIINVENVNVGPNKARGVRSSIAAKFVAKTYIYNEPKDGSSGGGDA